MAVAPRWGAETLLREPLNCGSWLVCVDWTNQSGVGCTFVVGVLAALRMYAS